MGLEQDWQVSTDHESDALSTAPRRLLNKSLTYNRPTRYISATTPYDKTRDKT